MSREIKFRAWDKVCNEWVQDWRLYLNGGVSIDGVWATRDVELIEYIGLKDNNGAEIYDGHVLDQSKFPEDDPCPYHVIFDDGAFRKQYPEWDETLPKPILSQRELDLLNDVIIGNIYENPELLENDHE